VEAVGSSWQLPLPAQSFQPHSLSLTATHQKKIHCQYILITPRLPKYQVELNHNISLTIHDNHHGGSTEGAGDIGRQRLTPGKSPTRSGGRSRRKRRHLTSTPVKKCGKSSKL